MKEYNLKQHYETKNIVLIIIEDCNLKFNHTFNCINKNEFSFKIHVFTINEARKIFRN